MDLNHASWLKRTIDLCASASLLLLTSPVIAVLYVLIATKLGRPVFFVQERPGLHGKSFYFIKFRTMRNANGPDGKPLPDDQRMTPLGTFLRKTSLDELPQFINVLKGELSLVGPRPLLVEYLPWYSPEQAKRHDVMPGITGWAQVNGRNAISWEQRFAYDIEYVNNWSNALDIKILFMTAYKIFKRGETSAAGHVTMPRFDDMMKERQANANRHSA